LSRKVIGTGCDHFWVMFDNNCRKTAELLGPLSLGGGEENLPKEEGEKSIVKILIRGKYLRCSWAGKRAGPAEGRFSVANILRKSLILSAGTSACGRTQRRGSLPRLGRSWVGGKEDVSRKNEGGTSGGNRSEKSSPPGRDVKEVLRDYIHVDPTEGGGGGGRERKPTREAKRENWRGGTS